MSFCPICKRNHDPDIYCTDGTKQILRDMGIEKHSKEMPKEEFKKLNKKAIIFLVIFALVIIAFVFYFVLR